MTTEKEFLHLLDRIAKALEIIAEHMDAPAPLLLPLSPVPLDSIPLPAFNGWQCGGCGTWVLPNVIHFCRTFADCAQCGATLPAGIGSHVCGGSTIAIEGTWQFPIAGTSMGKTQT